MSELRLVGGAKKNALLDYAFKTTPSPLQASPRAGDPAVGSIEIVVSNGTSDEIFCDGIQINLPVGSDAQQLTIDPISIAFAVVPSDHWTVSSPQPGQLLAGPSKHEYEKIDTDGITLQVANIHVNDQVGTAKLTIEEWARSGTGPSTLRSDDYEIPKFPYGFSVSNFHASASRVDDGTPVTLTWEGSEGVSYHILYGDSQSVDVSDKRTWTTPGLHTTTTFTLDASPVAGGTVHHYLSVTVTVAFPDIVATSLTVKQASTLLGPTTVGTAQSPQSLVVDGAATINGPATVGSSAAPQPLTVDGAATINGALAAAQGLGAVGAVSMMGAVQEVKPGSYGPAPSDGLVVGTVSGTGLDPNKKSVGWIDGSCNGIHVEAIGGNTVVGFHQDDGDHWTTANASGSFVLPVGKGAKWSVGLTLPKENAKDPTVKFWWVPLGTGVIGAPLAQGRAAEAPTPRSARGHATGLHHRDPDSG